MMRRFLAVLATVVLAAGAPVRPASASQAHVLRFTEGLGVQSLDPLLQTVGSVLDLSQLTMAHFVKFGPHGEFVPELITAIPSTQNGGVRDGGRTIVYHLRRGVRWSDGRPFDADDVAYTLRVIKDRSNPIIQHEAWDRLVRFEEPDKFTIVMHLDRAYVPFVATFFSSDSFSCVLPAHVLGPGTNIAQSPYNALPVGIGPFRYTAFRRGDAIEMEANPFYFGRKPKLQKIVYALTTDDNTIFAQLQTGEIDMWAEVDPNFVERATGSGLAGERVISRYMGGIYLNTQHPALADPRVRRALRLATDRKRIFAVVAHGVGAMAESVVAPATRDHADLPLAPFDPAAANRMLDGAGWTRGADGIRAKNGVRLALTVVYPAGYAPSATLALLLRAQWAAAGAEVTPKAVEDTQYFAPAAAGGTLETGRFDAALLSEGTGAFADVSEVYACSARAPTGANLTHYCNPAVDREMALYDATLDPQARAGVARRFQQQIDDDCPGIVYYVRAYVYAHTPRLTGFRPQTFGAFDSIQDADVI